MSSPQQPQPPAERSQAAQAALAVLVAAAVIKLWPSLDLLHLRRSLPGFKAAVAVEVQRHAQASATLAARQYRADRVRAGVGSGFTPVPADPPPVAQIAQSVDWALQPLWDSSVAVATFPNAPEETKQAASTAIADAKARLAAAAERQVLDTGWNTITDSVLRDRKAKAYARVPEPAACSFCVLLASRGAVYKEDAFARDKTKFKASRDFPDADRAHDNCRCHLEPVFGRYEPTAQIRQWQQTYKDVADEIGYPAARVSAADMQVAFRQRLEGRPIDLERSRNMRADKAGKPRPSGSQQRPRPRTRAEATPEEQGAMMRAEIAALEKNVSRLTNDQQREWTQKRIGALRQQLDKQGRTAPSQ